MNQQIERLNRMLGDHPDIGYAPDEYNINRQRQPRYAWIWSEQLTYPAKDGVREIRTPGGLYTYEPTWHMVPQYPEPAWALAKWDPPGSPRAWVERYGDELRYPDKGMYLVTDIVLEPHVRPNEEWTMAAIGAIKEQQIRNLHDFMNMSQDAIDRGENNAREKISDLIDSECMAFDSIPGKRGGATSWGGI